MKDQDIYKKIHDTYNSEKGKNFITHLLRSFFPVHRSQQVMFDPVDKEGKEIPMVCCITGIKLNPVSERLSTALNNNGVLFKGFMDGAKRSLDEDRKNAPLTTDEIAANEIKVNIANIEIAIGCEKSDKYLSHAAFQQLLNFYMSEIMRGNKHINWISNNERSKPMVEQAKKDGFIKTKKEERVVKKAVENHSGLTLGDFDVLKNLKNKLEKND